MKATHKGTCQICGASQKLPKGQLSKHGYTVDYGFFSGVCTGAHGLPFEQSTDLIEGVIQSVADQRIETINIAESLKAETKIVWIRLYYKTGYQWELISAEDLTVKYYGENNEYSKVTYKNDQMIREQELGAFGVANTFEEKIIAENDKRVNFLVSQANNMGQYVMWQRKRLANWTPSELESI